MIVHRAGSGADAGFRDYLKANGVDAVFELRDMENDRSRLPGYVEEIKALKPDMVYTQTTSITRAVVGKMEDATPEKERPGHPGGVRHGLLPGRGEAGTETRSGRTDALDAQLHRRSPCRLRTRAPERDAQLPALHQDARHVLRQERHDAAQRREEDAGTDDRSSASSSFPTVRPSRAGNATRRRSNRRCGAWRPKESICSTYRRRTSSAPMPRW